MTWTVSTAMRSRLAREGRVTQPGMRGARAEHEAMLHEQQAVPDCGWLARGCALAG